MEYVFFIKIISPVFLRSEKIFRKGLDDVLEIWEREHLIEWLTVFTNESRDRFETFSNKKIMKLYETHLGLVNQEE